MKETAKAALLRAKTGTLSVLDFETGAPFGAMVNVATDTAGRPLFLFSNLARHTKSLVVDPRASLLIAELPEAGDPLTGFRATIVGQMEKAGDEFRESYIVKHPYAELYANFGDFGFWRMWPEMIYGVAGFGRIQNFSWND
jgi:heme iron utilization protein